MHWTSDGFTYLYQWIYSCRKEGQFTSNFRSRACLTMPSLSGITIYRSKQCHFGPLTILARHYGPIFVVLVQIYMTFRPWVFVSSSQVLDPPPFFFFKENKALLASTIIFFEDTSCLSSGDITLKSVRHRLHLVFCPRQYCSVMFSLSSFDSYF